MRNNFCRTKAAILRWTRMCWGAGTTGTGRRTCCTSRRRRCRCWRRSTTPCAPSTTTSTQASKSCRLTTWTWLGKGRIFSTCRNLILTSSGKTSISVVEKTRRRTLWRNEKSTTSGWAINFLGHILRLGESGHRHIARENSKDKVLLSSIQTGNHIQYIHACTAYNMPGQSIDMQFYILEIGKPCNRQSCLNLIATFLWFLMYRGGTERGNKQC